MAAPQQQVPGTESKYKDYETKIGGSGLTLEPSYIQELSLKWQDWSSKGKYITLTGQVDRNLVGGAQNTLPVYSTMAKLRK